MDIAEQCRNNTAGDRPTAAGGSSGQDNDYSSGNDGDRRSGNRRNAENGRVNDNSRRNGDGRRQNNQEFGVMRQDFSGNDNHDGDNNGNSGNRGNGGNRGHSGGNRGNSGDRGGYGGSGGYGGGGGGYSGSGDHDSTTCDVRQPQQMQYYPPVRVTLFSLFFVNAFIRTYICIAHRRSERGARWGIRPTP